MTTREILRDGTSSTMSAADTEVTVARGSKSEEVGNISTAEIFSPLKYFQAGVLAAEALAVVEPGGGQCTEETSGGTGATHQREGGAGDTRCRRHLRECEEAGGETRTDTEVRQ